MEITVSHATPAALQLIDMPQTSRASPLRCRRGCSFTARRAPARPRWPRSPAPVFLQLEDGTPTGLELASFGLLSFADVRSALAALAGERPDSHGGGRFRGSARGHDLARCVCAWLAIDRNAGLRQGLHRRPYLVGGILNALEFLRRERGMTVVLLAHSAIETVNDPRAASYTTYQLRLHRPHAGWFRTGATRSVFSPDLHVQTDEAASVASVLAPMAARSAGCIWEARPAFVAKNRYCLPAKIAVPVDLGVPGPSPRIYRRCQRSRQQSPTKLERN